MMMTCIDWVRMVVMDWRIGEGASCELCFALDGLVAFSIDHCMMHISVV